MGLDKIDKFKEYMIEELCENSHKGDWEYFNNVEEIKNELEYHMSKLYSSIEINDKFLIKEYIADCANILLMLGNTYKIYE